MNDDIPNKTVLLPVLCPTKTDARTTSTRIGVFSVDLITVENAKKRRHSTSGLADGPALGSADSSVSTASTDRNQGVPSQDGSAITLSLAI